MAASPAKSKATYSNKDAGATRGYTPQRFMKAKPKLYARLPSPMPINSWEGWIKAMIDGGKNGLPGRPDSKVIEAELPVWVDCYFSHYLDQPKSQKNSLLSKLVLRSNAKICSGSLTEWVE